MKRKKTRPALSGGIMTRSAFKQQQQQLEKEENRSIQGSRGLDVAAPEGRDSLKNRKRSAQNDGDGKQKKSSAFKQQQVERELLLREEIRRIEEKRGFDFGYIPPMLEADIDGLYVPCWAEKSLYPAPKVYEDFAKIGLKSYNCQFDTSYQFTKILRVYFNKKGDGFSFHVFFQTEDKSVASPENFKIIAINVYGSTMVSFCKKEKDCFGPCCSVRDYYIPGRAFKFLH